MSAHAKLMSASAYHRSGHCPGSVILEATIPDTSSKFADEGTCAHFLAAVCLENNEDAVDFLGETLTVGYLASDPDKETEVYFVSDINGGIYPPLVTTSRFDVDLDMAGHVQTYIDNIRGYAEGNELMIERRVDFSPYLGFPDCFGTSDAIIIADKGLELQIHDLKYGMGVRVDAENNEQLMLYALGALNEFGMVGDFQKFRLVIHQPRVLHLSEWVLSLDDLLAFAVQAAQATEKIVNGCTDLNPGDKQCRWCKAKAICPALTAHVLATVAEDFVALDEPVSEQLDTAIDCINSANNLRLANCLDAVDLIEGWCKAIRAKVESELFAGNVVPGYKLVQGRLGNRSWKNEAEAEATFKKMRLKLEEMYDFKLISPTTAEKLAKSKVIGPRQWPAVQELMSRAAGKPSVAPLSDKRPALDVIAVGDEFDSVEETDPA